MAKCAEIIKSAYRRSGVKAAGVDLSALDMEIGMERLQGLYLEMIAGGTFGKVCDYYLASGAYTAKENQRIYKADNASVVTIPTTVVDADTGMTRAPLDGAFIVVVDPNSTPTTSEGMETEDGYAATLKLYDALTGWVTINDLTSTRVAPLSGRYEEGLKSLLAVAIADEVGFQITPMLARNAALAKTRMTSKNDRPRKPVRVEYF